MTLKYTTVKKFWEFLGVNKSIFDFQSGQSPAREEVSASPVAAGVYYLDNMQVNSDTLVLYVGDTSTTLTLTTHYTFDSNTSAVTITSAGATALTGSALKAIYEYNDSTTLNFSQTQSLLERMEKALDEDLEVVFSTLASPQYNQYVDSYMIGKGGVNTFYFLKRPPIVKLQTTVASSYTTGGSSLVLTDGTGFPNSGTIYIGGNKVAYTAKSTNTLTVPTTTPSISSGAVVRGEVIEVSTSASGISPVYTVLTPDSDYSIDYNTGRVQLTDVYYYLNDGQGYPPYGVGDRFRASFMHAWHDIDENPEIPADVEEIVYMMTGRQLLQRGILKSFIGGRDNFDPQQINFSAEEIESMKKKYRQGRVSNI